jgi:hypothetical protein
MRASTLCEAPCVDQLAVQMDDTVPQFGECFIDGTSKFFGAGRTAGEQRCTRTFDHLWFGRRGCCVADKTPGVVPFVECKP